MKNSIAMTLVVTAGIFSFVSGYSIGNHNDQGTSYNMTSQTTASGSGPVKTADNSSAPAGGYGAPSGDDSSATGSSSPGIGAPSPGYGAPSPGYGQ